MRNTELALVVIVFGLCFDMNTCIGLGALAVLLSAYEQLARHDFRYMNESFYYFQLDQMV